MTDKYCAEFVVPWHTTEHVQVTDTDEAIDQFEGFLDAIGYNGPTSDGQIASMLIFAACSSGAGHHETDTAVAMYNVGESGEVVEQGFI